MNKCYLHELNPKYEHVGLIYLDDMECTCLSRFIPAGFLPEVLLNCELIKPSERVKKYRDRLQEIELGYEKQREAILRNEGVK